MKPGLNILRGLIVGSLMLLIQGAGADEPVRRFYGYAYDLDSGRYLYTEVHAQRFEQGRWLGGTIDYYAADGSRLGRKTLDFSRDAYAPQFRLEQADGSVLALAGQRDGVELQRRRGADRPLERKHIAALAAGDGTLCADAGLLNLIHGHLAELQNGQSLRFTILAAGSLDSFRFSARKSGERMVDGRRAIALRLEPDSLLRLVAAPMELVYAPDGDRLLELRGPSNIRDPRTHAVYNTRVIYPDRAPADAPATLPPLDG